MKHLSLFHKTFLFIFFFLLSIIRDWIRLTHLFICKPLFVICHFLHLIIALLEIDPHKYLARI